MVDVVEPELRSLAGTLPTNPSDTIATGGIVAGIMGMPHSGKTTLLETLLPDYGPIAIFNVDGGAKTLRDRPGVYQVYTPRDWAHLDKMTDELCANPAPFKTIWTDVITMVQEESVDHYHIHDKPQSDTRGRQTGYGDSNWDVLQYHRKLIRCAEQHGTHIFFVYWASRPVKVEGSGNPLETIHIVLSPTVSLKVTGVLDVIVHIQKQQGQVEYPPVMTLEGDPHIEARLRLSPDNPLKKWPKRVPNPNLTKLINAYKGEILTP